MKADVRTTWRLLKPHCRPHLLGFLLVIVLGAMAAVAERSVFLLLKPTFNALFPGAEDEEGKESAFQWLNDLRDEAVEFLLGTADPSTVDERQALLWRVALIIVVLAAIAGLCHFAFTWVSRKIALRIVVDLRMRIARHLMGLSMRYHDSRHLGDLLSRVSVDVNTTLQVLNDSARNLIHQTPGFISIR